MTREQAASLDVVRPGPHLREAGSPERPDGEARLTPAEIHAMRRSAPLTPEQFRDLRRLADQGINPLRDI